MSKLKQKKTTRARRGAGKKTAKTGASASRSAGSRTTSRRTTHALRTKNAKNAKAE